MHSRFFMFFFPLSPPYSHNLLTHVLQKERERLLLVSTLGVPNITPDYCDFSSCLWGRLTNTCLISKTLEISRVSPDPPPQKLCFASTYFSRPLLSLFPMDPAVPSSGFPQEAALQTSLHDLLYFIWLFTSCPAAMADIRDSSPARTDPATMVARSLEFDPGDPLLAPFAPRRFRHAA